MIRLTTMKIAEGFVGKRVRYAQLRWARSRAADAIRVEGSALVVRNLVGVEVRLEVREHDPWIVEETEV